MSELVDRIGATIKEKGLTFNRVEHDCGLGNGTIKRWGDQSPRLDKLVRVSEYLDVSTISSSGLSIQRTLRAEKLQTLRW